MKWNLEELKRMDRFIRDLTESPVQNLLRDLERQKQLLKPPGFQVLRELQGVAAEARRVSETFSSAFSNIIGQYNLIRSLRENLPDPESIAADVRKSLDIFQPPALPIIETYAAQLSDISSSLNSLRHFENTFAGNLFDCVRAVTTAPEEELHARVDDLAELLETHIAQSRKGPVSFEGIVQIILMVLMFLHQSMTSQSFEVSVMERMNEINTELKKFAPIEKQSRLPNLRIVTAKALRVRKQPNTTGPPITVLRRNSLVRVLREVKSWAYVEYFDFITGRSSEGWVSKRYLRELPDEFTEY